MIAETCWFYGVFWGKPPFARAIAVPMWDNEPLREGNNPVLQ